jgi:hypothetical protein
MQRIHEEYFGCHQYGWVLPKAIFNGIVFLK